jgi:hypothetical protein
MLDCDWSSDVCSSDLWVGGVEETFTGVGIDGTWRLVEGSGVATAR